MQGRTLGLILGATALLGVAFRFPPAPRRIPAGVHGETVKYLSGTDSMTAYLAYPEQAETLRAVLVIDESFGTADFVHDVVERLAQKGFVALAPDLLSRTGGAPANPDEARKALAALDTGTVTRDLDAAATYVLGLRGLDDPRIGVIGFGWGGGETLRYAAHNPSVRVFVVCYGPAGKVALNFGRIKGTGLGVYADRDGRVTQGVYNLVRDLHKAGVDYRFTIYPNTGHDFLRTKQPARAATDAWDDITKFMRWWLTR